MPVRIAERDIDKGRARALNPDPPPLKHLPSDEPKQAAVGTCDCVTAVEREPEPARSPNATQDARRKVCGSSATVEIVSANRQEGSTDDGKAARQGNTLFFGDLEKRKSRLPQRTVRPPVVSEHAGIRPGEAIQSAQLTKLTQRSLRAGEFPARGGRRLPCECGAQFPRATTSCRDLP